MSTISILALMWWVTYLGRASTVLDINFFIPNISSEGMIRNVQNIQFEFSIFQDAQDYIKLGAFFFSFWREISGFYSFIRSVYWRKKMSLNEVGLVQIKCSMFIDSSDLKSIDGILCMIYILYAVDMYLNIESNIFGKMCQKSKCPSVTCGECDLSVHSKWEA